jgi:hypothetical protein
VHIGVRRTKCCYVYLFFVRLCLCRCNVLYYYMMQVEGFGMDTVGGVGGGVISCSTFCDEGVELCRMINVGVGGIC